MDVSPATCHALFGLIASTVAESASIQQLFALRLARLVSLKRIWLERLGRLSEQLCFNLPRSVCTGCTNALQTKTPSKGEAKRIAFRRDAHRALWCVLSASYPHASSLVSIYVLLHEHWQVDPPGGGSIRDSWRLPYPPARLLWQGPP